MDRTTKVTLTAVVSGYISGMQKAASETKKTGESSAQALEKQRSAMTQVGQQALVMGAAVAAGLAYVIKTSADFNAQMSQVQTLSHASADQMAGLRDAALNAGQAFGLTANQVADAESELVKAGISVKDILGGALTGALTLASAGQIDVAQATEIATIAMTQFALKGKDVPHVADLLAAGADKALGGVADLGEALKSGGLVAAQFGVSLDETVGTLSAFANAGLIGETAGTDLRQALLKLAAPSADSAKTMKDLGISVYDAQGQFVGMSALAGQLQTKMKDLDPATRNAALATIFGSRAIAGANVLYKEGAAGIDDWTNKVNDQGFAAQQAAGKIDNLNGDLGKLGAAFKSDVIEAGSTADSALRSVVQTVTNLVKGIGELPAPLQAGMLMLAAVVAAVLLLGGGFLTLVPRIAATKLAMSELNITGSALAKSLGKGGLVFMAVGAIAGAIASFGDNVQLTAEQVGKLNSAIKTNDLKELNKQFGLAWGTASGFKDTLSTMFSGDFSKNGQWVNTVDHALDAVTLHITHLGDQWDTNKAQFKELGNQLATTAKGDFATANEQFQQYVKLAGGGKQAVEQLLQAMPDYRAELEALAAEQGITLTHQQLLNLAQNKGALAAKIAAGSTQSNSAAIAEMSGVADDATGSISDLADAIDDFGKGALDVNSAERDFQAAIDDASDSVAKNGATLDLNTAAGRENSSTLDAIASKTLGVVSAQATAGASTDTLTGSMQSGRDAFIAAAQAAGLTADQANNLANQYGLIPKNVTTAIGITGADTAIAAAQRVKDSLASIQRSIDVAVNLHGAGNLATTGGLRIAQANGAVLDFFANGGFENHTAQIAPAGTTRVWNEPETGGEAYIPLAPSKRGRSLEIWQDTGARLGVQGYANGGVTYVPAPQQYATAPSAAAAPSLKGLQLVGTLDLGNGLEGRMRAVVADAFDADAAVHTRGFAGF